MVGSITSSHVGGWLLDVPCRNTLLPILCIDSKFHWWFACYRSFLCFGEALFSNFSLELQILLLLSLVELVLITALNALVRAQVNLAVVLKVKSMVALVEIVQRSRKLVGGLASLS